MLLDYRTRIKKTETMNLFFDDSKIFDDEEIKWFKEHNVKCKVSRAYDQKDFTIMKPENITWFHLTNLKVLLVFDDPTIEILYKLTWQ